jgi:hypothetical protein
MTKTDAKDAPKKEGVKKSAKKSIKAAADKKLNEAAAKYARGSLDFNTKSVEHKALRKTLEGTKKKIKDAATRTATTEVLLPSDPGFIEMDDNRKVYSLKQKDIVENVDLNTARSCIDLQLTNFGPYSVNFSNNGRYFFLTCDRFVQLCHLLRSPLHHCIAEICYLEDAKVMWLVTTATACK